MKSAPNNEWTGVRVLRRTDPDGTKWEIRRVPSGPAIGVRAADYYMLTCRYRGIRLTSEHHDVKAAQRHADDLVASWRATSLRDYQQRRSPGVQQ